MAKHQIEILEVGVQTRLLIDELAAKVPKSVLFTALDELGETVMQGKGELSFEEIDNARVAIEAKLGVNQPLRSCFSGATQFIAGVDERYRGEVARRILNNGATVRSGD